MPLDDLYAALPAFAPAVEHAVSDRARLNAWLVRLMEADAPSGGAWLPGSIHELIRQLAVDYLKLGDRFLAHIGTTGNAGIWMGADKAAADVIVIAHMDRPSFKVRDAGTGELYAICANRFPDGYSVPVRALRYKAAEARLVPTARGLLVTEGDRLMMQVAAGALSWQDMVVMDVEPELDEAADTILGVGLDNCLGVLSALMLADVMRACEADLMRLDRRLLIVFSDLEEGLPDAYFGHGAHKLTYAVPPPTQGVIIADAHSLRPDSNIEAGRGAGHGMVSSWSRGAFVPPNYTALAADLADAVNAAHPNTVQINTGYLSRSDDMALGRWTHILGMIGTPMRDAHTGEEWARLSDIPPTVRWLASYTASALAVAPALNARYTLRPEQGNLQGR